MGTSKTRGGYVRNVWFANISIGDVTGDALMGILTHYGASGEAFGSPRRRSESPRRRSASTLTDIRDIHFAKISRTKSAPKASHGPGAFGCFSAEVPCRNITFTDVSLEPAAGSWSCEHVSDSSGKVTNVSPEGLSDCIENSITGVTLV